MDIFEPCRQQDWQECLGALSFDAVLRWGLSLIGVGGFVIFLVTSAFVIQSWIDPARAAAEGARTFGSILWNNPLSRTLLAFLITLLVFVAQVGALGVCFLGGNYIGALVDSDRGVRVMKALASYDWLSLDPIPLQQS